MHDAGKKKYLHDLEKIKIYDVNQHCTSSQHKDRDLYTHFWFSPGELRTFPTITVLCF